MEKPYHGWNLICLAETSPDVNLHFGLPLGSLLGYRICTKPVVETIKHHNIQVYTALEPGENWNAFENIDNWVNSGMLKPNHSRTEFIVLTKQRVKKTDNYSYIKASTSVRNFDITLRMEKEVNSTSLATIK